MRRSFRPHGYRPIHSSRNEIRDDLPVVRFLEESTNSRRNYGPNVRHLLQLRLVGVHQRFKGTEVLRQRVRGCFTDFANAESVQKLGQGSPLTLLERVLEFLSRFLAHAFEALELLDPQGVEIGRRLDEPGLDELVDELRTQSLDIHCTSRSEV